ncbi:Peroxisomal membrane protein PMP22 [Spatholobus suberectus]|nr:Peroxisomal membrane protein PMP22 [Spatholobus suberectus]
MSFPRILGRYFGTTTIRNTRGQSHTQLPVVIESKGGSKMGSLAKKGLNNYVKQLQQHPLRTKVITAGVLSGISDIVSQKLTGIQKLQVKRLILKVIFGAAYLGPFGHFFHLMLDKIFKGKKDSKTVAKKVLIEQLTSSPWNNLLFMIYYGLVVEGQPWVHVKAKVKKDYPSVQYTSWTFWPVVGWINHKFLPLHFRVVFHSLVAFCWGIFLNLRARSMALTKA